MATYVPAKRATAYIEYVHLQSASDPVSFRVNPTLAAGDVKVSIDGGAFANITTLPTVTPASGRAVKVSLSASEMTGDNIIVEFVDQTSPKEWADFAMSIQTAVRQIDDLAYPATSGRSMVVDAAGLVDANAVKVGPSGSGTAQTAGDIAARLPAALVSGRIDASVGAMAADVMTAAAADASLTTELQSGLATAADLATVAGYIDTEVAAIKAKTDNLPAAPAATGDIPTANANADALLDRAAGIETGFTLRQTLRLMASVLLGKVSGAGTGTEVFRDMPDTKDRVTATVDASGNRTAITRDAT